MRKQTKLVAVLSAAALVALGASMTSMAAGWVQQDGQWYYEDAHGDYVYGEWKRSGDNYFYLGWDGYMLTNQLIQDGDNYYYVDANGAMVKNQWIAVATDDDSDVDHRWYRFSSTGRAYRGSNGFRKVTIEGRKYAFDEEGKMLYGWVDEGGLEINDDANAPINAKYFFGPNDTTTINGVTYTGGAMVTGWYNYLDGLDQYEDEGDDSLWLYFNPSTGEKTADTTKRIGGLYYRFNTDGIMESGWQAATGSTVSGTVSQYYSGSDQGWRQRNTWIWAVPTADMSADDNANDISRWFYVGADGRAVAGQAKRISSRWYIFDDAGIMKSGLAVLSEKRISANAHLVDTYDDKDEYKDGVLDTDYYESADITAMQIPDGEGLYYFSNDEEKDGSMKTGNNIQIELADGTFTFGFDRNGRAFDGVNNKRLYNNGILQTGGDYRYAVKNDPNKKSEVDGSYLKYVVGPTGTFASNNSTVRDADDNYYAVTGRKIYYVPADDYASRIASAIVNLGKKSVGSLYVLGEDKDGNEAYVRAVDKGENVNYTSGDDVFVRIDSETYILVEAEELGYSSYTTVDAGYTGSVK